MSARPMTQSKLTIDLVALVGSDLLPTSLNLCGPDTPTPTLPPPKQPQH